MALHRGLSRKHLFPVAALLVLLGGTAAGLIPPAPPTALAQPIAVGLVAQEGPLDDNGFNWNSYQGLLRAESELGVAGTVYTATSAADYEPNLNRCVADGNDLCLSVGFLTAEAMGNVANANPGTDFAIVDVSYDAYPANLRGITFASEEGAYLAGTLAGLMTDSDVLGVIGGMPIPPVDEFVYGFRNGARCANLAATVLISYTWDFANPDLGAHYARGMMDGGADVIFAPAGGTQDGALLTATQSGAWGVGVDVDVYDTIFGGGTVSGSAFLLTSALKRMDNAVFQTIADVVSGSFSPGTQRYGLAKDGTGLAPFHDADPFISQPVRDQLELVRQGILSGTIDPHDPCWAYTRYVDAASGSDGSGCADPNAPCATIGYAVGQAQPDDQVLVAAGTYTENLSVDKEVALLGGYSGPPDWQRDLLLYPSTIHSADATVYGDWDGNDIYRPAVISSTGMFKMWYTGSSTHNPSRIGYAESPDGISWTRPLTHAVLLEGAGADWDGRGVGQPAVIEQGGLYQMWYWGTDDLVNQVGYATSTNGIDWTKYAGNPVLTVGAPGAWDDASVGGPSVIFDGTTYHLWYHGGSASGTSIGYATSSDGIHWTEYAGNPVFEPADPGSWDSEQILFPAVLTASGHLAMWYSTNYQGGGGGIGYVTSTNGISWTRTMTHPVLPAGGPGAWDEQYVQTPGVLADGGAYRMWYTGYAGNWTTKAFGLAVSPDGISWTRSISNPVFWPGTPGYWGSPVVTLAEGSGGALLDGFTLTGGDAPQGAGVLVENGPAVTLLHLTVQGNHGGDGGGIRVVNGATALISATAIVSNTATWGGGVLVDLGGSATIVGSDIRGNTAEDSGGGIDAWWPGSQVDISRSTVAGNSARQGGGIHATEDATVHLTQVTLVDNTAGEAGGGLSLEQRARAEVSGSGFFSNTAFWGGGLHLQFGTAARLDSCRVEDNVATDSGGGIRLLDESVLTMTNSLVAGNANPRQEGFSGIEFAWPASGGLLVNVTVAGNELLSGVGGIRHADPSWPLTLVNAIVYGNGGEQLRCEGDAGCDVTYSDVQGGWAGTGNLTGDPLFLGGGDYHLQAGSPCVDTGTAAGAPAVDWEGDARPQGEGVDIGADEVPFVQVEYHVYLPLVLRGLQR